MCDGETFSTKSAVDIGFLNFQTAGEYINLV